MSKFAAPLSVCGFAWIARWKWWGKHLKWYDFFWNLKGKPRSIDCFACHDHIGDTSSCVSLGRVCICCILLLLLDGHWCAVSVSVIQLCPCIWIYFLNKTFEAFMMVGSWVHDGYVTNVEVFPPPLSLCLDGRIRNWNHKAWGDKSYCAVTSWILGVVLHIVTNGDNGSKLDFWLLKVMELGEFKIII